MARQVSARIHSPLRGILCVLIACTLFPVMNGLAKQMQQTYSSEMVVWARVLSHVVFILALFGPKFGLALVRTRHPGTQLLISTSLMASTICFFVSIKYVTLAEATAIIFLGPFVVAILARLMLGEPLSGPRLAAVAIGFLGVLIIVRPGAEVLRWGAFLAAASAVFYAFYQVFIRKIAGRDHPETTAFYGMLAATLVMSCVVPFSWKTPASTYDLVVLASLGVLGGLGHYAIARGMTYAPASFLSPFHYWQLIGGVGVGFLLFGEVPDRYVWLGSAVVIGAGLFMGWQETREKVQGQTQTQLDPARLGARFAAVRAARRL
jgi:drug/metabolite transporter (DMT)-like permease